MPMTLWPIPTSLIWTVALATLVAVPAWAGYTRGRMYAIFSAVVLGLSLPGAVVMHTRLMALAPEAAVTWLQLGFFLWLCASTVQYLHLAAARLRGRVFRASISLPGQMFSALGLISGVWLLALLPIRAGLWGLGWTGALDALAWLDLAPVLIGAASVGTSIGSRRETVRITLEDEGPEQFARVPVERHFPTPKRALDQRPLRIVQITDPHLGPWRSVARLKREIEHLLTHEPDLVLLTGDYLTMEGMGSPGSLARALDPLRKIEGRAFAIFGNHDHEAPEEVKSALASNGVRLLIDDMCTTETPVGRVEILGADYVRKGRAQHLEGLVERFPRTELPRVLLLHDPAAFKVLPEGAADLTLSGHTHGGQAGLVSLRLDWTVLAGSAWPDHGLFAQGSNRLYVHRGTGFYGFPMRLGVPSESSLLEVRSIRFEV